MFFIRDITRHIYLEPKYLGKSFKDHVRRIVRDSLEGRCLGKLGYVISVLEFRSIEPGLIDNDTGSVHIAVSLSVVFLRLFKHEVIDAVVAGTSSAGFFAYVGPIEVFVSHYKIPQNFRFNSDNGNYWECIDDEMTGDVGGFQEIREGSIVRLRVDGVSITDEKMLAIGTINDIFLG